MPFISQPSTMIVSAAPEETSFPASFLKRPSWAPCAPLASFRATARSDIPDSFGVTIGTFSARTRPGCAARQRVQVSRISESPPSRDFQRSPGR